MRLMSFALTTQQILDQTKTVTRRIGWEFAKPGDLVQPVRKAQGLKAGEVVERLGSPIRFLKVDRVVLSDITPQDVFREGFPTMRPREFVKMFKHHNGCLVSTRVTRIQFEYVWRADHMATGNPPLFDLYALPEDERIRIIAATAAAGHVAAFICDDAEAADRYCRKLEAYPEAVVRDRVDGPVGTCVTVTVGPRGH